jgi:hypothetical protein
MAELSRIDSKIAIEDQLSTVRSALSGLDKLTAQAEKLKAELGDLKNKKSAILKDPSRDDEAKLPDLLAIRGKIDLKQSSIDDLRGLPSHGNNTKPTPCKIEIVEQAISKAGEVVSQFLTAFHYAILVNLKTTIQNLQKPFPS